jgi:hypothetical protein
VRGSAHEAAGTTDHGRTTMIKVKTFATPIKIFATIRELEELDRAVTGFLVKEKASTVLALSDATTTGENGETIGLIRSIVYEAE